MNMRDIINLFEADYLKVSNMIAPIESVTNFLMSEYWYLDHENEEDHVQIWKHRDDPDIGEYILHLKETEYGNAVMGIVYRNPLTKTLNRKFETFSEFAKHVEEITNDPIDPEDIENATNMLKGIADDLKKKRGSGK